MKRTTHVLAGIAETDSKLAKKRHSFALAAICVWLTTLSAFAGTHTWTGGSTDGRWSVGANWEGNSPPFANESPLHLVFPTNATRRLATNNIANIKINSISFAGAAYTLAASGQGTNVTIDSSLGNTWWNVRALSGTGHSFHYSLRLALDGNFEFNIATNASVTVRSALDNATANSGLSKDGPGTLVLDPIEDNTFDGTTTVIDGVLRLEGSHVQFGFTDTDVTVPGPLVIGGFSMAQQPRCLVWLANQIGDSSAVTVNRNGQLLLADVNDTIGALTMAGGIVDTINGKLTLNGNVVIQNPPSGTPSQFLGYLDLGNIGRFFTIETNADFIVNAVISGGAFGNAPAGLYKLGPGWLAFTSPSNTFGGDLYISGGTVSITNGKQIGAATNAATVATGGTLALSGIGFGPVVNAKELNLQTGARLNALLGSQWNGPILLYGQASVDVPANTELRLGGAIAGVGGITKIGDGVLRFTGNDENTFAGGLTVEKGKTLLSKGNAVTSVPGPLTIGSTNNGGTTATVALGNGHQIANDATVTIHLFSTLDSVIYWDIIDDLELYGGQLTSSGGGLWTLDGQVNVHYASWPAQFSGDVALGSVLRTFRCDQYAGLLVSAPLVSSTGGGVRKTGPGFLSFYTTNSYTGLTQVEEGSLFIVGDGKPGSTAAGTEVGPNGSLHLVDATVIGEQLSLNGNGTNAFSLWSQQTNVWQGSISLIGGPNIRSYTNDSRLTLNGPMLGTSGVGFDGPGTVVLGGSANNTFQGNTVVREGTLVLDKLNAHAIAGNLVIGLVGSHVPSASVVCAKAGQFTPSASPQTDTRTISVNTEGILRLEGFPQQIANLTLREGNVYTGEWFGDDPGELTITGDLRTEDGQSGAGILTGASFLTGYIRLLTADGGLHQWTMQTNSHLWLTANVSESNAGDIWKRGPGALLLLGSNTFNSYFIAKEGTVLAGGDQPFGTVDRYTSVESGATLVTEDLTSAEPLLLAGTGFGDVGALVLSGTNHLSGPVTLNGDVDVYAGPDNFGAFLGAINGSGGLSKTGTGTIRLGGTSANSYSGLTAVKSGVLELAKTNGVAVTGPLDIAVGSGDGLVRYLRSAQLGDLVHVNIGANGQLRLLGYSDTIGSLAGSGIVELLAGTLTTGNDPAPTTYAGVISGIGGNLTKVGSGVFTLTGNNAYSGTTSVKGGTMVVNGQQPNSGVVIQTGGALGGNGTVGAISDQTGHLKPGATTCGALKCGALTTLAAVNRFEFDINGTVPGVNCDQLEVSGSVLQTAGTLQVAMNFSGALSNQYVIVKNDSAGPVTGTFTSLPENALLTANGVTFRISYHGGDGNDIVLIQESLAPGPQIGEITKLNDGTMKITVQGQPNVTYTVEATESLSSPIQWNEIGSATGNAAGQFTFTDPNAPQHPIRFYRFQLP